MLETYTNTPFIKSIEGFLLINRLLYEFFLSSTFNDIHAERDMIQNIVQQT